MLFRSAAVAPARRSVAKLPRRTATCSLRRNYKGKDDGIYWALQNASVIADTYSDSEIETRRRVRSEAPICNGDIVQIDGQQHRARVLGDYSDAVVFAPVNRCPNCGDTKPVDRSCDCFDNHCQ